MAVFGYESLIALCGVESAALPGRGERYGY